MAEPTKPYPGECQNPRCTREDGYCIGYHCSVCGEPTNSYGHPDCLPPTSTSWAEKQLQDAVTELWRRINAALDVLNEPVPHLRRTDPGLMGTTARRHQEQLRQRVRAALQGEQSARLSRDDEVLAVCRDALERGWTVEQLAERIRAVYDPALAADMERRARAAGEAGFDEPGTPPDPSGRILDNGPVQPFTDTDHQETP